MGFSLLLDPANREVGQKLGIATGCMFTLPVLSFYMVRNYFLMTKSIPKDKIDTYAAIVAIIVTNIIIGIYCFLAYREDLHEKKDVSSFNDSDQPRVGIYKQRTE